MRLALLAFICFILCPCVRAQMDDHAQVRQSVQDYIDGTAYNRPDLLERAFHPEISMYFTKRDSLWMPTRSEYIGFFSKAEPGTPSGRQGNIKLVEVAGDVATAKAEILILKNGWLFIDYFLLKRHEGTWKIMSKTASNGPSNQHGGRVLIVASNADHYGDTELPTGNHFGELTHAYDVFAKAGYTVDIASPEGGKVAISYLDTYNSLDSTYLSDPEIWYRLGHTLKVGNLKGEDYRAIYFPGGGAAMFGVADNPDVQRLITEIHAGEGVVAAVCHGTAGITGSDVVKGKRITGFPDALEGKEKAYYKTFPLNIEESIRARGGKFSAADKLNTGYFIVDGRVVTGMDHSTTVEVARAVVELLDD